MLSAETATGKYPVETVEAMAQVCVEAEKSDTVELDRDFLNRIFTRVDQSIAMATLFTAYHLKVKAIASLTESGSTALWMSRLNCGVRSTRSRPRSTTQRKMTLFRDVYPLFVEQSADRDARAARRRGAARGQRRGQARATSSCSPSASRSASPGGTNTMKIVKVGEHPT